MTFSTLARPGVSLQGGGGSGGGGGGTPGGSNTQIQYNSSGTFAGASGLTTNGTELTIASGTKTADAPVLNMSQTWNNAAVTFTGLKFNATDTASAVASLLLDIGTGGGTYVSRFSVTKAGALTFAGNLQVANNGVYIEGTAVGTVRVPGTAGYYGFTTNSASTSASTIDTFISRRAAANLRLGAADAAAPVAQTLSVQSVVAGTTNIAGANLTITGSQGTGTGAGGSIIFQVAPAGSSGSAQNALATALTISSNKNVTFTGSVTVSGAPVIAGTYLQALENNTFLYAGASADLALARDAANTLALRNGANAQAFNIYNTYTSSTSFERYSVDWITTANLVIVGPNKGSGGGTQRVQRLSYLEDGGAGSTVPLLGSTCPAASGTVKSWIKVITSDGTTAYIPCWA